MVNAFHPSVKTFNYSNGLDLTFFPVVVICMDFIDNKKTLSFDSFKIQFSYHDIDNVNASHPTIFHLLSSDFR